MTLYSMPNPLRKKAKLALALLGGHSWRLVSAVVISIPDNALASPA
jgi:hypothetical protein